MSKGRKKLPDIIKKNSGTLRKCRKSNDRPVFSLVTELPPPPVFLNDMSAKIYHEIINSMLPLQLINANNLPLMVSYCHLLGVHYEAEMEMAQTGRYIDVLNDAGMVTKQIVNPRHRVSIESITMALRLASEFGITPSAQTKIMSLIKKPEEVNPLDLV